MKVTSFRLNVVKKAQYPTGFGGLTLLTQLFGTDTSVSSTLDLSGMNTFFGLVDLVI
jgi:hypothetical protein